MGEMAHEVIKKHFPELMMVVATGDILAHLYSEGMVDDSTFDLVTTPNATMSSIQKGTTVLKRVQNSLKVAPDKFDALCRILKFEGDHAELADKLKGS